MDSQTRDQKNKAMMENNLPIRSFRDTKELRLWMEQNSTTSRGLRVRLYKAKAKVASISFHDLLEEGLCFGWSESKRHPYDEVSYLQLFAPRKTNGTTSARNRLLVDKLIKEGRMTDKGLSVLW